MSGQQIGSVVGGVIGAYFGGPMGYSIGSAIGGAVGGYVDPTVIKGPKLTDATTQTASDGVPIPWGFGTFPTAGNIIWTSELVERKKEDDGKGTGMVNVTYHYYRSYAISICQGVRKENGTYLPITGILQVKRNGKIVYDTTPGGGAEQGALNAKFQRYATFYLGSEDQPPDPVMESYLGIGNTPAYPGMVYMVVHNEELTDSGGAIPQYEFVVSVCGETKKGSGSGTMVLITGPGSGTGDRWAKADAAEAPEFVLIPGTQMESGDIPTPGYYNGVFAVAWGEGLSESRDGLTTWHPRTSDWLAPPLRITGGPAGWATYPLANGTMGAPIVGCDGVYYYAFVNGSRIMYRSPDLDDWTQISDGQEFPGQSYADAIQSMYDIQRFGDRLIAAVRKNFNEDSARYQIRASDDDGVFWPDALVDVYADAEGRPYQIEIVDSHAVALSTGSAGIWTSANAWAEPVSTGLAAANSLDWNAPRQIASVAGHVYVIGSGADAGKMVVSSDYGLTWGAPITLPFAAVGVEAGESALTPVPDVPGYFITPTGQIVGPTSDGLDRCKPLLAEIVAEVCLRSGLTADDFDVSQLTDQVDGFKVATETTAEAIITPLMAGFFFDAAEFDDKIRFVKRGGPVVAELTPDDLCESDGDVIEEIELQEVELLRKVHVKTIDPEAGFIVTTQTAERHTSTVSALGEQTTEIPVVTDKDTQAQMAAKKLKVGWAETRRFKTAIPYTRPDLTVTDNIGLTDAKGRRQTINLREMAEDSGRIAINEAMLYRRSAYTSNVTGVAKPPPTDTSLGLIGPTFGVPMNLPSLRTQDNVPGAYLAASGYLRGWGGCAVLLSADGGVSYQQVTTFTEASSTGILKANCTDSSEPLEVFMRSGSLSSITPDQLALRMNAFAITTEGVSEIAQFQTAIQGDDGIYDLTGTVRGGLGTTAVAHNDGDPFVMLSTAKFLPLDIALSGRTLYFKFVSFGTSTDDAEAIPFVFNPLFTSVTVEPLTNSGEPITVDGQLIYVVETNA